ncbi:unnamed protein product [Miscanthus lutarioriparius]|uniref:RING-type E3 ubiquitin transferase n=1 Tax=Miscanthus lutarioriparius TaxID=422564 RepID=A0A811MBE3_9POAL|nr:unnamed protein product [Miscanthus lutarioriparius]
MDAAGAPIPPPDASSPPPYGGQGTASFPIAIVIAIGFMVTSLILISYYFLVVRCWLRGGGPPAGRACCSTARAATTTTWWSESPRSSSQTKRPPSSRAGSTRTSSPRSPSSGTTAAGCPLCRTVVTGGAVIPLARDDHGASCRDLQPLGGDTRRIDATGRVGYGSSCRFPTKTGAAAQEPITRSFSMDCFAGGLGRKPQTKEPSTAGSSEEAGPSLDASAGSSSSNNVADRGAGETSGRFRRLLSSFGLGRSSRSTVLPIHLDP